jgi:hypothetical protein
MSFPQQSRSDMAAAEADRRRRDLNERANSEDRSRLVERSQPARNGVFGRFRAWVRGRLPR